MAIISVKSMRTGIRYAFYLTLGLIIATPIVCVVLFPRIVSYLEVGVSFHDVTGPSAQRRMMHWPPGMNPAEVETVSQHCEVSRDSSSGWYRIVCSADTAARWARHFEAEELDHVLWLRKSGHELESVQRTIPGPPDERRKTGKTPIWWVPPAIDIQATESMVWYEDHKSGVARAVYSSYDPSQRSLWVYEYTCQHDEMWTPGYPPAGKDVLDLEDSGVLTN